MDIHHLEYFMEVARQKSFSKAADAIHISQPSISKAIRDLENQLGVKLFYRSNKYVELTDAGEAILEQAQQIVSSFGNITSRLDGLTKLQTGKINIGLPPITGVTTFARVLGDFTKEYPQINLNLYEYGSKKIEQAIQEGLIDIGIICAPPEKSTVYEMIFFPADPLWLMMSSEHRLKSHDLIDYHELENEQFIFYSSDFSLHDIIIDRCRQEGFHPKIIFETSQLELMKQMVAANIGIALLPSKVCRNFNDRAILSRPLKDQSLGIRLALGWKKGRYLSHAVRQLLDFFRNNYNQKTED